MKQVIKVSLLLVVVLIAYNICLEAKIDAFQQWKSKFGVSLTPEEEAYRRFIFEKNVLAIQKHNSDLRQTYKMGTNQFTIYTNEEFISRFLKLNENSNSIYIQQPILRVSGDMDWTAQGKVSPVKNQGQCGSCWAFASIGSVQSFYLFKNETLYFSEQQLVDCSRSYGNNGCNGGGRPTALSYIRDHGITLEKDYPYVGKDQTCKKQGGIYKIAGYTSHSGCNALLSAITAHPIAVAVDASNWSLYKSGVFSNCATYTNHAVLIVGVLDGNWKIKNSWGKTWGELGFIRLAGGNTCGICQSPGVFPQ